MTTENNTDTSTDTSQADGATNTDDGTTSVLDPSTSDDKGGDDKGDGDATGDQGDQGQATGDQDKTGAGDEGEIEVKLPEGTDIDQDLLDGFKGVAKEVGLNSESATKVAKFYAERMKASAEAQAEAWTKQSKDWIQELKADSDFGGKAFTENAEAAARAVRQHEGLGKALREAGLDNWPPLVKAFAAYGKAMAEDTTSSDKAKGGKQPSTREQVLNKLYNNSGG